LIETGQQEQDAIEPQRNGSRRGCSCCDCLRDIRRRLWRGIRWPLVWWRSVEHDRRTANATVILAFATLIIGLINLFQWIELRKSDELQLRAYVFARLMLDSNVVAGENYGVTYLFSNDGKTPATDLKLFRQVGLLPYPFPVGYVPPEGELAGGGISLPPGANPTGTIRTAQPLSADDVVKATTAMSGFRLYLWGEITYVDVFGHSRWTRFCFSRPPEPATTRGVTWETTPGYNGFY
jgi:hypothetical protein